MQMRLSLRRNESSNFYRALSVEEKRDVFTLYIWRPLLCRSNLNAPYAGVKLDRALAQQTDRAEWVAEAKYIQDHITDAIIEDAFNDLPVEVRAGKSIDQIKTSLKGRRDNLVKIANTFYDFLAELQMVTGTDKDDYFEF